MCPGVFPKGPDVKQEIREDYLPESNVTARLLIAQTGEAREAIRELTYLPDPKDEYVFPFVEGVGHDLVVSKLEEQGFWVGEPTEVNDA